VLTLQKDFQKRRSNAEPPAIQEAQGFDEKVEI
jgi:hypothetical protein